MVRKRRTRRTRVKAEVVEEPAEVVEEVEEEELDEEEEEAPPKKTRRRRRKVEPEPEPEEDESEGPLEAVLSDVELAETLFETLLDGDSLTITRTGKKVWVVASGGAVAVSGVGKLSGRAYNDHVQSQEYKDFRAEWRGLSFAEKTKRATKLGVEWEEHDDPKIEVMRISAAVREHLGIEKYKEEYRTRSARAAIKA